MYILFLIFHPLDPSQILLFCVFIVLSAFFSGTEIALVSLSKHAIQAMKREKLWWSESLEIIKRDNDTLLITILIGNNLVNVAAASLATATALKLWDTLGVDGDYGVAIATGVVTMLLLIFGEITPKTICIRYASSIALAVAPFYRVLIVLLSPLSFFLNIFVKGISKLFWANGINRKTSSEEVEAFIDMSHADGAVEEDEKRQIKNLLGLSDMTADSVMTPRVNVEFLSLEMTVDEVCDFMMKSSHSRLPVHWETRDDVEYVITFREAFQLQREGHGDARLSSLDLEKIMKVSLTQALDDLFEKFQKSRRHIALVLDEHGGTAGVVTMEDVLEEVFGDIKDEKDKEAIYMRKSQNGSIEAIGSVLIDDILEEFNLNKSEIELPEEYMGETLSYVLMAEEEWFPNLGDIISFGSDVQIILRVLEVHDNVIERVECKINRV